MDHKAQFEGHVLQSGYGRIIPASPRIRISSLGAAEVGVHCKLALEPRP